MEKAIQSVLSQTYQKFELIVVNDGSTDNSWTVVNNFQQSTMNCQLLTQENQGVSVTRNNGVKVAQYDYIAFLDADDWWEPTYLEEMKSLIDDFPQAAIYGSGYFLIKNGIRRIAPVGVETNFDKGEINYCKTYSNTLCMPLWTGATIIRKTIFESEHGFKPSLKLGEDFDLWIRVVMKYPAVILNKPLSNYNQDVELEHRAIGEKLYEPSEHMLFTDYGESKVNPEFRYLYERLAVYGLLPYYLTEKNRKEVELILSGINWKNHAFKYRLYYKMLPKRLVQLWMNIMKLGSVLKSKKLVAGSKK